MSQVDPGEVYASIEDECSQVLVGNDVAVRHLTIALLTRGHVLLEGVPGVAKTTLANLFARSLGLSFSRIQMTPDILPADITGTQIYQEGIGEFRRHRGPIFANLVVADEINRATPKTQSALLEAMQERHVTIEGETLALPEPFMVIATQNPLEFEGVYELPEAQRDRFQLKVTIDIPERELERHVLERFDADPTLGPEDVSQVVDADDLMAARDVVDAVHVAGPVAEYILDIAGATREHPSIEFGASPRAALALQSVAKGNAAIAGREYVIPDDVKDLVRPTLEHRLVLTTDSDLSGVTAVDVLAEVLESVEAPGVDPDALAATEPTTD